MPIREDYKQFYGEEWVAVIRPRILARASAKDGTPRCERCGKPDRVDVISINRPGLRQFWRLAEGGRWRDSAGSIVWVPEGSGLVEWWQLEAAAAARLRAFPPAAKTPRQKARAALFLRAMDRPGVVAPALPEGWMPRLVTVVLSVAHVNHTPTDQRDDNLLALCQFHHLLLDLSEHAGSRKDRKDDARPILRPLLAELPSDGGAKLREGYLR